MDLQLNRRYTTKEVAEFCQVAYSSFLNKRELQEKHLALFYHFTKETEKRQVYYTFQYKIADYVPYRKYKSMCRNTNIQKGIKDIIQRDNRQTGSNIARLLLIDGKFYGLDNFKESTLTVYTRAELKKLVDTKYYAKTDYAWCYLDKARNCYVLLSDKEIEKLRTYFEVDKKEEEIIISEMKEGNITYLEAERLLGKMRIQKYLNGLKEYAKDVGYYPMKVPVYEKCVWAED